MGIRSCALESRAFKKLLDVYTHRDEHVRSLHDTSRKIVGTLGWAVPDELIIAAGMTPVRVCAGTPEMNEADKYLEYSFAPASRAQFERLADGTYAQLCDYIAVSDSADVQNRLYYYLREIRRSEPEKKIPEIYMIDWLFSRHMMYQLWNEKALGRFAEQLEAWSGNKISAAALADACALVEENRRALADFNARRAGEMRVSGAEALVVIGAGFFMDKAEHTALVREVTAEAAAWPVISGTRAFYTGGAQEDTAVYKLLEENGLVIVGEDHDFGARSFASALTNGSTIRSLVSKYMLAPATAQKNLVAERVEELLREVREADAQFVVFYNYEYEEAASWDYPSQKRALDERGIGSVLLNKMKYPAAANADLADRIAAAAENLRG